MFLRSVSRSLLCALLVTGSLSLLAATATATEARDPLRDVRIAWEQAMLAGDARAAATLFDENATQMRPGRPTNRGRAAIEAGYAEDFRDATVTAVHMTPSETRADHKRTLEHGTFVITWSPRSSEAAPMTLHGRYLLSARQGKDGRWKIDLEMHTIEAKVPEAQLR